ncbi:alanyl-tRNA editing protein ['Paenibacillus yunnanensis' Narsing Rao et al. 2020]|uniref:alanyl-tRNA editing protein n=1 Tax=Paenibacillus tengchongensis TaxID=2608684 RepID=UPI00124DEDB7|nr:alanyl-tRNA editing protein [Paenibacillus tengchongensis]
MTKKLYYESAYMQEWQTTVTGSLQREGKEYVTLAETAFYPHGGGQPCDTGQIGNMPVLDVILEGEEVLHQVETALLAGETVNCALDWERRFDHMQQHSGQHLLSALFREQCGAQTLSFHLGVDYATIDIALSELEPQQLSAVEAEVNRHIYMNHAVSSYFVSEEELARLPLAKQPKVTENFRIVEISNIEYNACGGTHVSATGAIGMIKLLRADKQKGHVRVTFKCGGRALREFNDQSRILGVLAAKYNTGKDEIIDRIEKWEQEQKRLETELGWLKESNDTYAAQEMVAALEPGAGLIRRCFEAKPLKDLQSLAAKLTALTDLPVLLLSAADNKAVLAHSGQAGFSCGAFFKAELGAFSGKGGGSDKLAQAGFPSREDALAFYEFAGQKLRAAEE